MIRKLIILMILLFGATQANAATTSYITQYGITWTFDAQYEFGQFANGDYWVVGPVTINSITPAYDGASNGWEVNPDIGFEHGFDDGCKSGGFRSYLVPSLPYTSTSGVTESIVKTISKAGEDQPCVQTAGVLTVLTETPNGNGASIFRPPYTGTTKTLYSTSDLQSSLLPSYPVVAGVPSLASIITLFTPFRLDHGSIGATVRNIRPADAMENYNPKNTAATYAAIIRMMCDDYTWAEKLPAMIKVMQMCLDKAYMVIDGYEAPSGDGHNPGHRGVAAFAAVMLDIAAAKTALNNSTGFHEDSDYMKTSAFGESLYGESSTELQYWNYIMGLGGSRSRKDPYSYIDGGKCGVEYQLIVSQTWKAEALLSYLMPAIENAWHTASLATLQDYADRWVATGILSQPDPCAPYDGNNANYGITFGPDSGNPGMCILDTDLASYTDTTTFTCTGGQECGRYPAKDDTEADGGLYKSIFIANMWDAYNKVAILTGTMISGGVLESEIRAGGQRIQIDLSGTSLAATFGDNNPITTVFIENMVSNRDEPGGWNAQLSSMLDHSGVTRLSSTQAEVVLTANGNFDLTQTEEVVTVTIPASAVESGETITATPTFPISVEASPPLAAGAITGVGMTWSAQGSEVISDPNGVEVVR